MSTGTACASIREEKVYDELSEPFARAFSRDTELELEQFGHRYDLTLLSSAKMRSAISCLKNEQQGKLKSDILNFPSEVTKRMFESPEHNFKQLHESVSCMVAASHVERQLGCKEAMLGNWIAAAQRWRSSLRLFGWNASSEHLLGLYSLRSKDYQKAEEHLRRSVAMDPEFKATYVNLSAAYLGLDNYESVEGVAQEGLRRYPQAPECRYPECSHNLGVATTMSLVNEIGTPIGSRQKLLSTRSQEAVRLLQEAREDKPVEKVKTESTCGWLPSEDDYVSFLEELARHLDCDRSRLVYFGC